MNIWKETQPIIWIDIEDFFSITRNKIIISSWTAAEFYGFSNFVNKELNFTVPISYNNKSLRAGAKVKQRNAEKISFQLETYMYEDKVINIYSPERTFIEIFKENINNLTDTIKEFIKGFFREYKYSKEKLFKAAKWAKVEKEVKLMEMFYG